MGGGGGCVIQTISLEAYQKKVGDLVMTVDTNTDTYTFVSGTSHTIKCYNIEFAENDTLVIAEGANVILEGTLTIEKETLGIDRITVNGSLTLEEGSAITFGSIIFDPIGKRGARGIVVNSSNSLYINGGEITIDTINGIGIKDDIPNNLLFVKEEGSVIMNDGSITINSIKNGAAGIVLFGDKATFTQNGGSITIDKVIIENDDDSAFSFGLCIFNGGTFNQIDGSITINKLIKPSSEQLNPICIGILILNTEKNASKFNQRGGSITIEDLQSNFGISINLTASGGGGDGGVDGGGDGGVDLLSQFEQTGGSITVKNVGNLGFGVLVGSTEKPTFFVNNLTVIGNEDSESSIGLASGRFGEYVDPGVVNSGIVRVYDTNFYYVDIIDDEENPKETDPSPTNDPNNNTNFTGTGKYYNTKEN